MTARAELMVVGGGKMGEALVAGLIGGGRDPAEIVVVEQVESRRSELSAAHPGLQVREDVGATGDGGATGADGAVIAVKPGDVESVCRQLSAGTVSRVLSIAAGVRISSLESWLGPTPAVIRAMPNTPALVGAGAAAIAAGSSAGREDLAWARGLLESVGIVVELPESDLDAVTGLSGSGPAYVFLVAEALIEAGVHVGLSPQVSRQLTVQTLLGSARLLAETGEDPANLRTAVTSPGGTTAAGLKVLDAAGLRGAIAQAVAAATARSVELGAS